MSDAKPSDERNGCFLDSWWCCKVCDGEIPDGHTNDCDIWKLEKKHMAFIANEFNNVLAERDALLRHADAMASAMEHILNPDLEGQQDGWDDIASAVAAYRRMPRRPAARIEPYQTPSLSTKGD